MPSRDRWVASLSKSLSGAEIDALLAILERRELAAGEVVIDEGAPLGCAYLVAEGALRVLFGSGGASIEAGRLEAGSWIGEVSLLDGGPATATIIADTPAVLLGLPRATLERLRETNLELTTNLVRAMCVTVAGRVRSATDQLEALRGASGAAAPPPRGILEALRALFGGGA